MVNDGSPHGGRQRGVVDSVVAALRGVPCVVAVGAYGSTATEEWTDHSDVDLLAVMNIDPPVESLRFFVNGIAVDLNLRLCGDGAHGLAGADFVPDAVALWDPDDVFIEARPTERVHNAAGSDVVRYMLFHDSQKLRQIGDETL